MDILLKDFPEVISDNEEVYFGKLIGVIESVDELSSIQISKIKNSIYFRIAPSHPKYNNNLLGEIISFHNLFGIHLDLSKSIKTSGTINFQIML